ncbi:MAG TPA: VIT1/CCC1 transporter family protein [Candidatus Dormibacteraeota bacterium]|nr:VIT1/CCC1 transporter family protein [Candidatus Dormibacteraeota bacterium]
MLGKAGQHYERHPGGIAIVRDIVLGMSDGLTVPFALAAGISGAIAASHIVITAGVAELAAGGISMGLGGYLAARTQHDFYTSEERREREEVTNVPDVERAEIAEIFQRYGLEGDALERAVEAITSDHDRWVDFMMRFELGLEKPIAGRDLRSALTIGGAYVVGGVVPLIPYVLIPRTDGAFPVSAIVTAVALLVFGIFKGRFTGVRPLQAALQTVVVGGIAAAVAFALARLVS